MPNNDQLIQKFNALGDPTRYSLLSLLAHEENICVSELAQKIQISTAGVSQQLKILEKAGIIKRKRIGQRTCYEIDTTDAGNKQLLGLIN